MKLSQFKSVLKKVSEINFELEDGTRIPQHFHITEVGEINKKFVDCGGVVREEKVINFQLWHANDFEHRLNPEKTLQIIELSEEILKISDAEIEVEYQSKTIGKYKLDFNGRSFVLLSTQTECLAEDACGIPQNQLPKQESKCTPGSGCC
ncbi:MAG: hypothetical protein H6604_06910 [Flavobacteriales bacterium]|nr:hypothetical protein [Flavobacteriales bacterium]